MNNILNLSTASNEPQVEAQSLWTLPATFGSIEMDRDRGRGFANELTSRLRDGAMPGLLGLVVDDIARAGALDTPVAREFFHALAVNLT